jgi:hypothetical protein
MNRYVYDINHYFYIFGKCDGKDIRVDGRNDNNYKLGESLDLKKIKNDLMGDQNYLIESGSDDYYLGITRNFNDKQYYIRFTNNNVDKITHILVTSKGDSCTEPDYSIEQRAYKMIDELPLSNEQKKKIKNNIHVPGLPSF